MNEKNASKIIFLVITLSFFQNSLLIFEFDNDNNYNNKISAEKPNNSAEAQYDCVDAWIIVGGDRSDHEASDLVLLTTEWVYDKVLTCGSSDDDIYYIVPEISEGDTSREDATTSRANIQDAFTTWAPARVGANGVLGVYLHDHGGTDSMSIAPHGGYTATNLDDDLDAFEAASGCDRIIVIYEACSSGSFLDDLSQSDRIILTSSEPGYSAYWSPIPPHISMFGETLFNSMLSGNSIGDAFVDAQNEINALGYGGTQHPCIDDNHDGVGHIVNAWGHLPSTGDGNDAKNTYLCVNCPTGIIDFPAFLQVPLKSWVGYTPFLFYPLSVSILNTTNIKKVYCRVVPEDWTPPDPLDDNSMGRWDSNEDLYRFELFHNADADGNFTGFIEIDSPVRYAEYNLSFIVEDVDGNRGPIVTTHIEFNDDGIAPVDEVDPTVIIINPADKEVINETVIISVEGTDDNSGLDEIQIYINGELKSTTEMPNYFPYPEITYELNTTEYKDGDLNITAKAVDKAGNSKNFSINVVIDNSNSIWDFLPDDPKTIVIIGGAGIVGLSVLGVTFNRAKKKRIARASSKGVFRENIPTRGKVYPKVSKPKTSRAGTIDKGYWKKTRSKTSRAGNVAKNHTKKTIAKSSRTGMIKITKTKTSRADMDKVSTKKSFFSKLFRR